MPAFFSKIRKGSLSSNSFSRYLLYAAGEILLVVIGILIALQVNTWDQERTLKRDRMVYLKRLNLEIRKMHDHYRTNRMYQHGDSWIVMAQKALQFVEKCGDDEADRGNFDQTLQGHQIMMMYMQIRTTYDEMVSSGAFAQISDDALKESISSLYSLIDMENSQIPYYRDELGRASAIINQFVSFSYDEGGSLLVQYSLAPLCSNIPFKNAMAEIIDARQDWVHGCTAIKMQLESTLSLLSPLTTKTGQ